MNAQANMKPKNEFYSGPSSIPFMISLGLHIVLFVLATVGIPFLQKEITPPDEMIMTVELVDIAEIAQTDVLDEPQKDEPREDEPEPPKPKPVYNNNPDQVPDLATPEEPEIDDSVPEPPKDKPKPDPQEIKNPPKPKSKPKPPKRPKPPKPEPKKEEPKVEERNITSLMNDLLANDEAPQETPTPTKQVSNGGQTSQIADFGKQLTRSEMDDLNYGVSKCWNVNAGGKYAETLIVSLRVFVNPDMRVRDVQIIDSVRYSTDSHFQAAADAARWALLNPECNKLRLPAEKYEYWKVFKYHFDPSDML